MITIRYASDRGGFDYGWLDTRHTFSFGRYYDPDRLGFRALRVINEDRVAPGEGFGAHSHRDMEILTWVISGAVEHRDSMGNGSVVRPGELQLMRAGTGVTHSEMNPSPHEPLHLLQIWIVPAERGLEPGYQQRAFPEEERRGRLRALASPDGREGSLRIAQDVALHAALLAPGETLAVDLASERHAWLQVVRGELAVAGHELAAGDGAAVTKETALAVTAAAPSELLLFDLA